jgi:YihY family inner membrane protein
MLVVVALSHFLDEARLLLTLRRYLELLVPGQSASIVAEVAHFLGERDVITWVLVATMLFFSSFAFTVLENAMSVIFVHRVAVRRRHFLVSALLPYCYILALGFGVMIVTLVAGTLQVIGTESVELFGYSWSLHGVSGALLYLLGLLGEILVLTSIYLVMPAGRRSVSHALVGGVTAALLWEIARHVLVWYFSTLSKVNVVYGSMSTAIVVMFSLEIGAALLLFGAQVIAEYERVGQGGAAGEARRMETRPQG